MKKIILLFFTLVHLFVNAQNVSFGGVDFCKYTWSELSKIYEQKYTLIMKNEDGKMSRFQMNFLGFPATFDIYANLDNEHCFIHVEILCKTMDDAQYVYEQIKPKYEKKYGRGIEKSEYAKYDDCYYYEDKFQSGMFTITLHKINSWADGPLVYISYSYSNPIKDITDNDI